MIEPDMEAVALITSECKMVLVGAGPTVQGAVLADLVSSYFAGDHPEIREEVIATWLETTRELIGAHPLTTVWDKSS